MKKFKTKCKICGKSIMIEYSYDYDTNEPYKPDWGHYCSDKCRNKADRIWEKEEAIKHSKYLIPIKGIKNLSSKKEFIKCYSTLNRHGVEVNPEDKNQKCHWCKGKKIFRYVLNDWEYMWELLCIDCMKKIIKVLEKKL